MVSDAGLIRCIDLSLVDLQFSAICAFFRFLCFALRAACNGDSGGPLVHYDSKTKEATLIGLVSWGYSRCGEPGIPAVYSRVSYARQWIHEMTNI